MTDHQNQQDATDTFIRPCLTCGTTIHVVAGVEQPHEHHTFEPDESRTAHAWWQGYDAHRDAAADSPNVPSSSGARVARYAEAIMGGKERAALLTVRNPGEVSNAYRDAAAVMAVADAELAEAREEVERLRENRGDYLDTVSDLGARWHAARDRAEAAEAKLRDVEALADEWRNQPHPEGAESVQDWVYRMHVKSLGSILRAVLARSKRSEIAPTTESEAPVSQAPAEQEGLACRHGRQLGPDDHGCARCREENLALALAEQHMHEFEEDVDDGSMCVCGVPATEHRRVEPHIQAAIRDCRPAPSVRPAMADDEGGE